MNEYVLISVLTATAIAVGVYFLTDFLIKLYNKKSPKSSLFFWFVKIGLWLLLFLTIVPAVYLIGTAALEKDLPPLAMPIIMLAAGYGATQITSNIKHPR